MRQALLTDIEGTTTSIAFVKGVLFPLARQSMRGFVDARGRDPVIRPLLQAAARVAGCAEDDAALVDALERWMDADVKQTALKALQGHLWEAAYREHGVRAHVYPDAVTALEAWAHAGHALYVYSSGSARAQRALFRHSTAGDLSTLFAGYFDTEVGPKRETASYAAIVEALARPPAELLFASDTIEELDAAREAGLCTVLVDRSADQAVPRPGSQARGHRRVESFSEISLAVD